MSIVVRTFRGVRLRKRRRSADTEAGNAPVELRPGELFYGEAENTIYFGKEDGSVAAFTAGGENGGNPGEALSVLSDTVGNTTYTGVAPAGSATSAEVWTIRRIIFTAAGVVDTSDSVTDTAWDDRLTAFGGG